jgi:F-type H+-transporting ATPase subunit delta
VAPVTARLFYLLLEKGRTEYVVPILQRVKKLVREDRGIFDATVVSAIPLGAGDQSRLRAALEEFMRARLEIEFVVDPRVLGGVRFQCGDLLVDDTVRGKLQQLKSRLEAVVNR